MIADLDGARALHRAGKTALVYDVYILGKRFAVYKLEVLKLPLGIVARGRRPRICIVVASPAVSILGS